MATTASTTGACYLCQGTHLLLLELRRIHVRQVNVRHRQVIFETVDHLVDDILGNYLLAHAAIAQGHTISKGDSQEQESTSLHHLLNFAELSL